MNPTTVLLIIFIIIAIFLIIIGTCCHRYLFENEWNDCIHASIRLMIGMGSEQKCVTHGQKFFVTLFGVMAITTFYIIISILVVYLIELNSKKKSETL